MNAAPPRRLFVGLQVPRALAGPLAAAVRRVLDPEAFRLHGAGDLHLTLCFVGAVEAARVPRLAASLDGAFRGCAPAQVRLQRTGRFPARGPARVLWAGPADDAAALRPLVELAGRAVEAVAAARIGWAPDPVPFTPHVTLARPRTRGPVPAEFGALPLDLAWRADEVCLFESAGASAQGTRYPVVGRFGLVPPANDPRART